MDNRFESVDMIDLESINGGSFSGALALAWGITKAAGIVGGTAVTVYGAGKAVKKVGDWVISKF